MYRVYLRDFQQHVFPETKTATKNQAAAAEAFTDLVDREELDGQKLAAVLTYNNRQLAFHRFDREPGCVDFWRDKLDEIDWPAAGRPAEMAGGKRVNVYLDAASLARASELGNGNISEGIRLALAARPANARAD